MREKLHAAGLGLVVLGLFTCLFADSLLMGSKGYLSLQSREAAAVLHDAGTQWAVFLCVVTHFLTFLLLQHLVSGLSFWRATNPSLWLTGVLILGTLAYTLNYSVSSQSTQALTLLAGAALGVGATVWSAWRPQYSHRRRVGRLIVAPLVVLLVAASLWPPEWSPTFAFRGYSRWTGPWPHPNTYGLLMGVGIVLAISSAVLNCQWTIFGIFDDGSWKGHRKRWKVIVAILYFVSAALMSRGLLHSYSRGAWCGTIVGLMYLAVQAIRGHGTKFSLRIRAEGVTLAITMMSIFTLAFWHYRATAWRPAQRTFSVLNARDVTRRDRITAWESALQITAEHPWFGAGWNQPERLYQQYYFPLGVPVGADIGLNDYLLLGATLGIPALGCFEMYIWLCLKNRLRELEVENQVPENSSPTINCELWTLNALQAAYRAGAIVLLIGFWFDSGLFYLPTAATFWILIELGRRDLAGGKAA